MSTTCQSITLRGEAAAAGKPTPKAAGRLLSLIAPVFKATVSMGFRHASRLRGRWPDWLRDAADIRFVDMEKQGGDGTCFYFEAPKFGDVARSDIYGQGRLFEQPPSPDDTGFDLLGDVVTDIRREVRNSDKFDAPLLQTIGRLIRTTGNAGIDSMRLTSRRFQSTHAVTLDTETSISAADLQRETPQPKRARITGTLDMIRDSDNVFGLILERDHKVRGIWTGSSMTLLKNLFGETVVLEGKAVFSASGALLRLDADAIAEAGPRDRFFSKIPKPTWRRADEAELRQRQTRTTGANAVFGKWPGDESEEEILATLKELG